jgi:hypothetical protein
MPLRQHTPTTDRFRSRTGRPRRRVLLVATLAVPLVVVGGAGVVLAATTAAAPAPDAAAPADPNPNCTLIVPANPLSAAGLATPYQLMATDRRKGACHESNDAQAAFVEAAVLDPATGAVSVYHPLVVDRGTRPAAAPVTPTLPAAAVVGIWFGSNGDTLTLRGAPAAANCVNGLGGSLFGQYAYCNARAFFTAANAAVTAKKLTVPAAQTARDGLPCPTVRDFSVVDQDQSDNVVSSYLILGSGRSAQDTAGNRARFGTRATRMTNGSDNGLVDRFVGPALGCAAWTAPDLGDPGRRSPALALNELQAAASAKAPIALVPTNDPMTLVNDKPSVAKTNLYRAGVDQPALAAGADTGRAYCRHMVTVQQPRLRRDRALLRAAASPDTGTSLYAFLVQRLHASYDTLGCADLLGRPNPIPATAA